MQEYERIAWLDRMRKLYRLSAHEAASDIDAPVYGLTEELYGLQHIGHAYTPKERLRIEYASPRYEHRKNFTVETRLYAEEQKPPHRVDAIPVLGVDILVNQFPGQDRCTIFIARDASITIDGECFKGYISYYTHPVHYSEYSLCCGYVNILGEALGPSIDEVMLILENLHMLNSNSPQRTPNW